MWYQKDWFTGSDYYNLKEKQIHAEEIEIKKPLEQKFHERTEIYYVKSGDADIWINGDKYQMKEGVFCCLYMHHFYRIEQIRKPLRCVKVSFHIGLFMFLCFEQHKENENEVLMYGVPPLFVLNAQEKQRVLRVLDDLLAEEQEEKFLPYSSVRLLRKGDKNDPSSIYAWAQCSSIPSNPASFAFLDALA